MLYVTFRKAKVGCFSIEILPWVWNVMSAQQTLLLAICPSVTRSAQVSKMLTKTK
jgi:hypothetical protein